MKASHRHSSPTVPGAARFPRAGAGGDMLRTRVTQAKQETRSLAGHAGHGAVLDPAVPRDAGARKKENPSRFPERGS